MPATLPLVTAYVALPQDTKTRLLPTWKAGLFPVRPLRGGVHLPPLESSVSLTSQGTEVFFPVNRTAAYAQFGPHPIEIPNTDQDAEPFLQGGLHHMTRGVRSLTTRDLQELSNGWAEFGRMPMPPVLQGGFSSHADIAQ